MSAIHATDAPESDNRPRGELFLRSTMAFVTSSGWGGALAASILSQGCIQRGGGNTAQRPDLIIGQRGLADGRFQTPRAIALDQDDHIFVVDKSGRIQRFDPSGKFVLGWRTPEIENGKPTGISIDRDGTVMVADTHYYRFLFYTPEGNCWRIERLRS